MRGGTPHLQTFHSPAPLREIKTLDRIDKIDRISTCDLPDLQDLPDRMHGDIIS